jgi:hypothetical protein
MLTRSAIVTLLLAVASACLFEFVLRSQSRIFGEFEADLLSVEWMLVVCLAVWCGTFIALAFSLNDLPLIGLLLVAIAAYSIGDAAAWRESDDIILLAGVMLGKVMRFALMGGGGWELGVGKISSEVVTRHLSLVTFLFGLVVLLAFSSWWHLDMSNNFYHGPRWMGLWDNPNIYGMLMGAGTVLAAGLLTRSKKEEGRRKKLIQIFLMIVIIMMGVGLAMSYSRGAWAATAIGLLYLTWYNGKLKWRFVLPGIFVVASVIWFFWNATSNNAPWYVKRMDLGRPSAQHRVAAWKAGVEIMRDHPFGVGWNKAIETYEKHYSPPEDGAGAITMNSYLMLGTQLGLPGLICFVGYVALQLGVGSWGLRARRWKVEDGTEKIGIRDSGFEIKAACRAGAFVLLVAFWFDGGLFNLATASVFWILLELGAYRPQKIEDGKLVVNSPKPA